MRTNTTTSFFIKTAAAVAILAGSSAFAAAPTAADLAAARRAAEAYRSAITSADLGALYASLPQTWRKSLGDTAKAFATTTNPELLGDFRDTLRQIAATAVKKNDFVASLAGGALPVSGVSEAASRSAIVTWGSKIAAVAAAATPERLAAGDLGSVLSVKPLTMKGVTDVIAAPAVSSAALSATARPDGSVRITGLPTLPGVADGALDMVRVDGTWVPKNLAAAFANCRNWPARAAASKVPDQQVPQMRMALGMLKKTARSAASAQTAEQFSQIVQQAMLPVAMLSGSFGGQAAPTGLPF